MTDDLYQVLPMVAFDSRKATPNYEGMECFADYNAAVDRAHAMITGPVHACRVYRKEGDSDPELLAHIGRPIFFSAFNRAWLFVSETE